VTPALRHAGDAGLLLEFEPRIDEAVHARVVAVATALRAAGVAGVRDIVPTYRSVAVHLDPAGTDRLALDAAVARAIAAPAVTRTGETFDVPVVYGGEAGPDLADVAARAGLDPQAVIALHAAQTYRVFMIGFLPGFPYLGLVDERIASPRLASPRLRVPAGSVGLAGRQTGIYPQASPGGWRVIGRTPWRLFDGDATPPARLQPGDLVRFRPVGETDAVAEEDRTPPRRREVAGRGDARCVTVLSGGLLTTVQDEGRWGCQASGVPVAGALDLLSHRAANAMVGNGRDAAGLEVTLAGPVLRMEQAVTIALAGADLSATLDGAPLRRHVAVRCRAGSVLRFGDRRAGARAYVAFDGGIGVPLVLGSRATHLLTGMGGFEGRALAAGDRLPLGLPREAPPARRVAVPIVRPAGGARVRVLPGPQADGVVEPGAVEALADARARVSVQSDRMGYRLAGVRVAVRPQCEMISDATFAGGLQVPPSGEPVLLLADRQTTGGYPQVATVITADLPRVAQLAPGDWIAFTPCTRAEALAALIAQEAQLLALG
jgi:KipI family sensor histidine kinase inhibitor